MSNDVVVYSSRFCGYCRAAKRLLKDKGVAYKEIDLDNDQQLRAKVMRDSGQRTVPQIWVGKTHIGGFSELDQMEKSGQLDTLLQQAN